MLWMPGAQEGPLRDLRCGSNPKRDPGIFCWKDVNIEMCVVRQNLEEDGPSVFQATSIFFQRGKPPL